MTSEHTDRVVVKSCSYRRGLSGRDHLLKDSDFESIIGRIFRNKTEKDTWHVQAVRFDGRKAVVSDSAEMTEQDAESLAKSMRED